MESDEELAKDRRDLYMAGLSSFVITVLAAVPALIPILLIPDLHTALFVASAFGATALFFVGYGMSRHIGANRWGMALMFMTIGWAVTVMATFMGG
ncbi:hypothetical protein SDC9_206844 [bioreactor metagenome]|uniref:VIT family protein n=1 Tax=bioreactor metagenome TaxID=1076179 RepID=A0A645J6Q1_9ZZZZ